MHSFHSLLRDLATCTLNEVTTALNDAYSFTLVATPTLIQAQVSRCPLSGECCRFGQVLPLE